MANYEWLDAIDVVNMVDACELIVHSSLERKESRGPFIRTDFPATDNRNWLVANVLKKSGNGLRFEQRPYSCRSSHPVLHVRDNLRGGLVMTLDLQTSASATAPAGSARPSTMTRLPARNSRISTGR